LSLTLHENAAPIYPLSGPVVHGAAIAAVALAANSAKLKIKDLALSLMSRILQVKVNEALSQVLERLECQFFLLPRNDRRTPRAIYENMA
jgi:hypothetical protein